MTAKQVPKPALSNEGQQALDHYGHHLRQDIDLQPATIRNYLGDLRLFIAWCERVWSDGHNTPQSFSAERVATPTLTRYRDYLQHDLKRKAATVNRYLISLKRYFNWATEVEIIARDPARAVKLVAQTSPAPRHLSDQEEADLVAAVSAGQNLRDYTLIVLMLHTGLRIGEVCNLKWEDVVIRPRSGQLHIWGKRNKYRQVPLNVTARKALEEYKEAILLEEG